MNNVNIRMYSKELHRVNCKLNNLDIDETEKIIEALPSGSGFDYDWKVIKQFKNGKYKIQTYHTVYNENGCRLKPLMITIYIDYNNILDFDLYFNQSQPYIDYEYLFGTISARLIYKF